MAIGSTEVMTEQSPGYAIRDYRGEDEDGVLTLLHLALGGGRSFVRDQAFWRWKHLENHFGRSQLMVAANSEVLGLRAFMRWQFAGTTGERIHAVRAVDTATHPGYRRLGIFSKLTRASLERARADGGHLIFNTPNRQSMPGYLKLGWQSVGRPRLLIRVIRPLRMAAGLIARAQPVARAELAGFFRTPPHSVDELLRYEEHLATIIKYDDGLSSRKLRTARSVEFIRWRYASCPSLSYAAIWTGHRPVTEILIVRPNNRFGLRELMLCEVLVGYGSAPHMRELIETLVAMTRADYLVAAASPCTEHWGLLRRAGFVPLPSNVGPDFTVFPLNWPIGEPEAQQLDHWQLSLGDLEIF